MAKRPVDADNPILIRKYPNRRLYNTATSSYIVLDDVVELVKAGTPFVIEDKKTGEDITRTILNQIIFEQEIKPTNYHFPLEVQKQLISMYGDTYGALMPDYLTQSMKTFAAERSKLAEAVSDAVGRNTNAVVEFNKALAQQNMEMFRKSWEMFSAMTGATKSGNTSTESQGSSSKAEKTDRSSQLDEIQAQIDALQDRLKALK